MIGDWPRRLAQCGVVGVAACACLLTDISHAVGESRIVDGWRIKARTGSNGGFLTCSMGRTFAADRGTGAFRITLVAWHDSLSVLMRGNKGFLTGGGVAKLEVVSGSGTLFDGDVTFQNSEMLFVISDPGVRSAIKASPGWALRMNGRPFVKFPMTGARAAMTAVEKCAKLPTEPLVVSQVTESAGIVAGWSSSTGLVASDTMQQLLTMAQNFSSAINRPGYQTTGFKDGVLQWSYDDQVASAAATIVTQEEAASSYASRLSIRADQCDDSVLTLPVTIAPYLDGERATVVSMCREDSGVRVRHIHVAKRADGTTYVINFEDIAGIESERIPETSGALSGAFQQAVAAAVTG